jgi:glutathione synthase
VRIALLVNRIETEDPTYTTTRLAQSAVRRGHEVWYLGCEDLVYDAEEQIAALATRAPTKRFKDSGAFLAALQDAVAKRERIDLSTVDVLLLRNDPAVDQIERPWAQTVGILFGQALAARGVLVLNDPTGLSRALNKMYFQHFPQEVRPITLISRDADEIRRFVKERGKGGVVLKPLQGSGGQSVFLVTDQGSANLNQIIEAVQRFGYVVAQEYLPAAAKGDTRFFLLNGRPLEANGHYCAFSRVGSNGDLRTNVTAGGRVVPAKVTDRMLELAEAVRPRLVVDGMFLVGLDIAGDRLLEINVFSPGGVGSASRFEGVDFTQPILDAIEAKLAHRSRYADPMPNHELAVL